MKEIEDSIRLLDKLIIERQEHFQHSLSESAEQSLIAHLKKDIDFLREKRAQLLEKTHVEE